MFKIKIFKMQLLKNYTANPVNSTWSSSIVSSSFMKNCLIRGAFSKKNQLEIFIKLIGRRGSGSRTMHKKNIVDARRTLSMGRVDISKMA